MLDPPSKDLLQRLTKLKLCTPSDLKRCRRRVKKLARGIPAFDSVWIDALVQKQKITPFQARVLESDQPERLAIGPYLLISEIGQSYKSNTYTAKAPESVDRCVVKVTQSPSDQLDHFHQRFQDLLNRSQGLDHPSLVIPRVIKSYKDQIVIISRYVSSITVSELLVRRGRFPVQVILAIGVQILDALATLEKRNLIHGDIRPWNVRLTPKGTVVLVDTGVEPILSPELTIHASLPPRCYDGISPELIGTGQSPNCQSDLYAVGCLLWELLAGRPPFTTGDPLAKLACHQTKTIPDVRTWAPETPKAVADALLKLTASNTNQRPSSMHEAQKIWPAKSQSSHKLLQNFTSSFQTRSPRSFAGSGTKKTSPLSIIAVLIFVLSGLSLTLLDEGARNQFLKITSDISFSHQKVAETKAPTPPSDTILQSTSETHQRQLIPPPNGNGIIELDSLNPYESTKITTVGPLTIRGVSEVPAIIHVHGEALSIVAEQLTLENVILIDKSGSLRNETLSSENSQVHSLLNVTAQSVFINSCFLTQLDGSQLKNNKIPQSAIYWKTIDPHHRTGNRLEIKNTLFAVPGDAIHLSHIPQSLILNNCLNISSRSMVYLESPPEIDQQLSLTLKHLTLRNSGPLLLFNWMDQKTIPGSVQIEAQDCVFDITNSAMIQVSGYRPPENWLGTIGLIGEGSLASSEIRIACWQKSHNQPLEDLDASKMLIEGVSTGKFKYAAPLSLRPADSVITEAQVARKSSLPPGVQAQKIPELPSPLQTPKN